MSLIGQQLGNYRIIAKIGEGGMGTVYLAEHAMIGRRAAIKVLLREMSHSQDLVSRFFNEARAATSVKHPGIVEIYDFGYHTDGSAFIVMEFLEGESLSARIRRLGTLSEGHAARLTRQVASALEAAHGKGIVHRDLKPDNIYVVGDSEVADGERTKVLDFGIAKLATDTSPGAVKTRTGAVIGTPIYMAPEQCKGAGHVDHRADLYALGCILYEMVCGRPPFLAEGSGEILAQHIYAPVIPPSQLARVSPGLEQVLLRLLAKEPGQRYQSARELTLALQQAVPSSGLHPPAGAPTVMAPASGVGYAHGAPTTPLQPVHTPVPTTLGSSTGVVGPQNTQPPPGRSKLPLAIAGIGLLAAGIGLAVHFSRSGGGGEPVAAAESEMPKPEPPRPEPPKPEPPKPPDPPPKPPEPPKKITLSIKSSPTGAEVYRMPASVRVGKTPFTYPIDAIEGELVFVLRKNGFKDQTVALAGDKDGSKVVELERKPRGGGGGTTKPGGGGTLDPFDKLGGGK
jgi:eukaryotic-like serine/threonine-protein kinase